MARLDKLSTLGVWWLWVTLTAPALAHTAKVSGDVAATFHIEPNHNPKAGQPSQAWFALTQRGGKVISFEQCNCKLKIHLNPHKEGDAPTLEPVLKPISTAQYQNVPGADITFPKSGAYELEISGTPKAGAMFQPFELSYEVTVMAGVMALETGVQPKRGTQSVHVIPTAASQKGGNSQFANGSTLPIVAMAGLGIAVVAAIGYALGRKK
jgi:hypothetical protein